MGEFFGPKEWGRVLTAMVTAFDANGAVNFDETAKIADYLVDKQANDGVVVSGTTGESPTLSDDEKINILKLVLETVGSKASVIFGSGSNDTAHSIELTKRAEKAGAHGIMIVNPYYSKPGQRGLEAHFRAIAAETSLPVMIYNIQPRSAINLETETLQKLMEVKNIVAVKEASGSIGQAGDVCRVKPQGFRVYSGDDGMTLPMMSVGAHGVVSVVAHVVGRDIKEMVSAFPQHPHSAAAIHHRLTPVFKALFSAPSPTPVKYALSLHGFDCEGVRLPLVTLSDAEKEHINTMLQSSGAIASKVSG